MNLLPLITEKSYKTIGSDNKKPRKFCFTATIDINKNIVKKLLKERYNVDVLSVNITNHTKIKNNSKYNQIKRFKIKKVYATVKAGQSIRSFNIEEKTTDHKNKN